MLPHHNFGPNISGFLRHTFIFSSTRSTKYNRLIWYQLIQYNLLYTKLKKTCLKQIRLGSHGHKYIYGLSYSIYVVTRCITWSFGFWGLSYNLSHGVSYDMNSHIGSQITYRRNLPCALRPHSYGFSLIWYFLTIYLIFNFWHILTIVRVFLGISHWLSHEYKKVLPLKCKAQIQIQLALATLSSFRVLFLDILVDISPPSKMSNLVVRI